MTTEITISLPSGEDRAPLYVRYPRQNNPQPAFLEFDPNEGTARFGYNAEVGPPHGVPMDVWHGRIRRYSVPGTISPDGCAELAEGLRPLLARVAAGYSERWDGSNYKGRLNDDAQEAEEEIENTCTRIGEDESVSVWDAEEWVYAGETLRVTAATMGIEADTTDEFLAALAATLEAEAKSENVVLDGDLADVLAGIRDGLRE